MENNLVELKGTLDYWFERWHQPTFIEADPIRICHQFHQKQDQELMGLWTCVLAWGRRAAIIQSAERLIELMDGAPYAFIQDHSNKELERFHRFVHRTFQPEDALYFIDFFKRFYQEHGSLEEAFIPPVEHPTMQERLQYFFTTFFSASHAPVRTQKHIAHPARGSTCKRMNLYLRWMVRSAAGGVDLGIWKRITPAELMIPLDVHVEHTARALGILKRKSRDWKAVEEIMETLRVLDPLDPVKYDYALFGMHLEKL